MLRDANLTGVDITQARRGLDVVWEELTGGPFGSELLAGD
jgi:hypothetical protein